MSEVGNLAEFSGKKKFAPFRNDHVLQASRATGNPANVLALLGEMSVFLLILWETRVHPFKRNKEVLLFQQFLNCDIMSIGGA